MEILFALHKVGYNQALILLICVFGTFYFSVDSLSLIRICSSFHALITVEYGIKIISEMQVSLNPKSWYKLLITWISQIQKRLFFIF